MFFFFGPFTPAFSLFLSFAVVLYAFSNSAASLRISHSFSRNSPFNECHEFFASADDTTRTWPDHCLHVCLCVVWAWAWLRPFGLGAIANADISSSFFSPSRTTGAQCSMPADKDCVRQNVTRTRVHFNACPMRRRWSVRGYRLSRILIRRQKGHGVMESISSHPRPYTSALLHFGRWCCHWETILSYSMRLRCL